MFNSIYAMPHAGEDKEAEEAGSEEGGKYGTFWKEFGRVIKLGIIEDAPNRSVTTPS